MVLHPSWIINSINCLNTPWTVAIHNHFACVQTDSVTCPQYSADDDRMFDCLVDKQILPGIGHDVPQEAPQAFARAIDALAQYQNL